MIAPAGFGKTTVARAVSSSWPLNSYCDAFGTSSLVELARRVIAALAVLDPVRTSELSQSTIGAANEEGILAEAARASWRAELPDSGVLVLDHLEQALGVAGGRDFIASMLDRPHNSQHLILCCREPLKLRVSRFAPPHEVAVVTAEELRFTDEDIAYFFTERPTAEEIRQIRHLTQGWPIGVLFMANAAREQRLAQTLAECSVRVPSTLEDYVLEEVLAATPAHILKALVAISAIPECTSTDITHALNDSTHDERSVQLSPFVTVNENATYTVHPLLRSVLLQRYSNQSNDLIARAAAGHASSGNAVRAAKLFQLVEDFERAADCLDTLDAYFLGSPSMDLAEVVASLTASMMVQHPALWSAATLARVYAISLEQWLNEARTVWKAIDPSAALVLRAGVVGAYANAAGVCGSFQEGLHALDQFEETLRPDERAIGELVLLLWRTAFAVWRGERADVSAATAKIAPLLQSPATDALWTYNVVARDHRSNGNRFEEATALSHARRAAYASELPFVKALVLTDVAIHQWFWGEDDQIPATLEELNRATTPAIFEGMRHFLACFRGAGRYEPTGFEKPKVRVFSYLIAAANAEDAESARWLTTAATATADQARSGFHQVISRVACALVSDEKNARDLWREAADMAQGISENLYLAVRSLAERRGESGMLTSFARRFIDWKSGRSLAIRIFALSVEKDGQQIPLQRRELEIVTALALYGGPLSRERLSEAIWPDQGLSQAATSLRVYVNRIRNRLGRDSVVLTPSGYALAATVAIDIVEIERLLRAAIVGKAALNRHQKAMLANAADCDMEAVGSASSDWTWFPPYLARIESVWRDAALLLARAAMEAADYGTALKYTARLLSLDGDDNVAQELMIAARRAMGDDIGSARLLKQRSQRH
ncbi:MAG TPA: winged helix-turn-helix domain-containing protein [Candidatus Baltobacteraceae bacterium]|nr:winged helix-turn-helix domain-containing protein [Candidatus Baltobacteraceae bacterium]